MADPTLTNLSIESADTEEDTPISPALGIVQAQASETGVTSPVSPILRILSSQFERINVPPVVTLEVSVPSPSCNRKTLPLSEATHNAFTPLQLSSIAGEP